MNVELFMDQMEDATTRAICSYLHELIMGCHPKMHSKIRFKIPFYDVYTWICYINPQKKGGVELVFLNGKEMINHYGLLDCKGRKLVSGITLTSMDQIKEEELLYYIMHAVDIDTEKYKQKNK